MKKLPGFIIIMAILIHPVITRAQWPTTRVVKNSGYSTEVETADGKWFFSLYPNKIIKASFRAKGSTRNEQVSDAVIAKSVNQKARITSTTGSITVTLLPDMSIRISKDGILFMPQTGIQVNLLNTFYSDEKRGFQFSLQPEEMIFGTGERSVPLNRRGYKLPLNNSPAYGYSLNAESLNYSVPFILSSEKYAIFFDNPSKGFLDIGKTNPNIFEYQVTSGELSFYIIAGNNYETILEHYHSLVGTAPLPPRWAMGNLVSRFGYRDEKQVKEITGLMQKDSVPFDAVIFDLFWFGDSIKNTIGNLSWVNKKAWPDPKKMIGDFNKQNIKTILITEPFVLQTSLNYEQSKSMHATDSAGKPYILQQFYFGKGGIIDIFRKDAQQWFYKKYKDQMDIGVTGWWGDLGEPENHPADVYHNLENLGFKRKFASGEIHNIYGHYWSEMLATNFKKDYPNKRLFHLNRSGYAGTPRFSSFPWSGDVSRSWNGLKGQLPLLQGMSISGIPYIHSDAGGFAGGDGDPALYVRWLQFAAFTPIYRPHGGALGDLAPEAKNIPSEASLWPEPTKSLAKEAAVTRYRWMPYNYTLSYRQTKFGEPLLKPMFFLDNADSNLYKATDQYLWGDGVIVVPITDSGQKVKLYYLPKGNWTNMSTFVTNSGPGWVSDSSINMKSIPVLAREGSFIPLMPGMQTTADYNNKILEVIYVPSARPSSYSLYEDDGKDANALLNNHFELTHFKSNGLKKSTEITVTSNGGKFPGQQPQRNMQLTVINLEHQPVEIKLDGQAVALKDCWNDETKKLTIPVIFLHKKTTVLINF